MLCYDTVVFVYFMFSQSCILRGLEALSFRNDGEVGETISVIST
jgi:hypothetical protein